MNEKEIIHINGIREDLYQAMQIGSITLSPQVSADLYNFMNYQDKEIERLNNIINEIEDRIVIKLQRDYHEHDYRINTGDLEEILDKLKKLKESGNNE